MKIKQLAGIIIAALVFVIVTVTGIYVNNLTDKKTDTLGLFGGKTSEITQTPLTDYIGLIRIEGTIMSEESGPILSCPRHTTLTLSPRVRTSST